MAKSNRILIQNTNRTSVGVSPVSFIVGMLALAGAFVCCGSNAQASLIMATASDLVGGDLVTFDAPTVVSSPYIPAAGGVTFSSTGRSGIYPVSRDFNTNPGLGWEGAQAPLSISFDIPAIATHWVEFDGRKPDQVELFSDTAFANSLGIFDIDAFGSTDGNGDSTRGFISDEAFSSMRLIGASSSNLDDFRYASAVPEPSSMLMMALVLTGIGTFKWVQRSKSSPAS